MHNDPHNHKKGDSMSKGKSPSATNKKSTGFTDEEKAAMKARAQELKAEARANKDREGGESAALAAIAKMKEPDRTMAKRLHAIIKAGGLLAKTWYGMPAYVNKDGKVVCLLPRPAEVQGRDMRCSASTTQLSSTKAPCGRSPSR